MKWGERGVRPTEQGWYWVRFGDGTPFIRKIIAMTHYVGGPTGLMWSDNSAQFWIDSSRFDLADFAGPIPEPTE